jgi:hypothetical protein
MNVSSVVDILQVYAAHVFRANVWRALTFKVHICFCLKRTTGNGEGGSTGSSSRPTGTVDMESYENKETVLVRATKCIKKLMATGVYKKSPDEASTTLSLVILLKQKPIHTHKRIHPTRSDSEDEGCMYVKNIRNTHHNHTV